MTHSDTVRVERSAKKGYHLSMVEYVKILNYVQSKDFWEFDLDKCDSIIFIIISFAYS